MIFSPDLSIKLFLPGDDAPIDPNEMVNIKNAFKHDDPQILDASLLRLHRISNQYNSFELETRIQTIQTFLDKIS